MWYIILFVVTLVLDQVTKIITDANQTNFTVIENVLNIRITYNKGASFSFLADKEWAQTFFIVLTIVVLIAGISFVVIKRPKGKWLNTCISLMLSGTIGNFIDRLAFKYVRDFIDVPFFANFNIADCCLCIGAGMLIFYVMFLDVDAIFPINKQKELAYEETEEGLKTLINDSSNEESEELNEEITADTADEQSEVIGEEQNEEKV